jgi:hypothetical protein
LLPSIAVQHPMLTVAALAHYISDQILTRHQGYFWS